MPKQTTRSQDFDEIKRRGNQNSIDESSPKNKYTLIELKTIIPCSNPQTNLIIYGQDKEHSMLMKDSG